MELSVFKMQMTISVVQWQTINVIEKRTRKPVNGMKHDSSNSFPNWSISMKLFFTLFFILVSATLQATTYYVNSTQPNDTGNATSWGTAKKTIQAAINISASNDTIVVTNGIYASIITSNKTLIIQSVNGAASTIIDGGNTNRCATLGYNYSLHTNTVLQGFTIRNGNATNNNVLIVRGDGGGTFNGTLNNCIISSNTSGAGGGSSYGVLNNCTISGNLAGSGGGSYAGTLNNCIFSNNTATVDGGGSFNATVNNGIFYGNSATRNGGGSHGGTLKNCTISGNTAISSGGGSFSAILNNCIVWGNTASSGSNDDQSTFLYSCTTPAPSGGYDLGGNISLDPQFVNPASRNYRLQATSPCVDKGFNGYSPNMPDLDGNIRIYDGNSDGTATVDIGAFEYGAGNSSALSFDAQGGSLPVPSSQNVVFGQQYGALATTEKAGYTFNGWWSDQGGTGLQVTSNTVVSKAYDHALYAKWIPSVSGRTLYVNNIKPDDSGDGLSWDTAKKTIQSAINESVDGETILVTNGVYTIGGGCVSGTFLSNRVIIAKAVTVVSVNGPTVTLIQGTGTDNYGTVSAVRPVYMENGTLDGFTLKGGATHNSNIYKIGAGGGVYAGSTIPIVKNCIIQDNKALNGGGSFNGTLKNCIILANSASSGGGSFKGTMNNCIISSNTATVAEGGGSYQGTLNNCIISSNSATVFNGGGSASSTLNNCTIFGNSASGGGGSYYCTLNNCTITKNIAQGNYGGGSCLDTLNNCIVWDNMASSFTNNYHSTFRYSCTTPAPSGGYDLGGNIILNPLFTDSINGDLRLQEGSPCINVGTNAYAVGAFDLSGNPRIISGRVDMGAYEFTLVTLSTVIPVPFYWIDIYYPGLQNKSAYEAIAIATGTNGRPVWESYLAGLSPTNPASAFIANISISNDFPIVIWSPDIRPDRVYTVLGKTNLTDTTWGPTNSASRFFKVTVDMP